MVTFNIIITEITTDFVSYKFTDLGGGFAGRQWFPGVEIGQLWTMECDNFKVVKTRLRSYKTKEIILTPDQIESIHVTPADIFRVWRRLWGDCTPEDVVFLNKSFDNETVDFTQYTDLEIFFASCATRIGENKT